MRLTEYELKDQQPPLVVRSLDMNMIPDHVSSNSDDKNKTVKTRALRTQLYHDGLAEQLVTDWTTAMRVSRRLPITGLAPSIHAVLRAY